MRWKATTINVLAIASVLASAAALRAQVVTAHEAIAQPGVETEQMAGPLRLTAALNREHDALPDAPGFSTQQDSHAGTGAPAPASGPASATTPVEKKQTKRILYIVPNFRAVSANQIMPPQTVKEKFKTATLDSVDYSSFVFVAIQSGLAEARNSTPVFRQGAAGYGRYFWHTYADYVDENLWVEFIIPAALRQDSRYYTLGHGSFAKRFAYSASRIAITRTDSGHETFNASEIFGAGAAAGISNLYYPSQERTFTKSYQRWITSVAIDGGTFVFKEFWPDLNSRFFHQKD